MAIWCQLPIEIIGEIANKLLDAVEDNFVNCIVHSKVRDEDASSAFLSLPLSKIDDVNDSIRSYTVLRLYLKMQKPQIINFIRNIPYKTMVETLYMCAIIKWRSLCDIDIYRYFIRKCSHAESACIFMNAMLWTSLLEEDSRCYQAFIDIEGTIPDYVLQYSKEYLQYAKSFNRVLRNTHIDHLIKLVEDAANKK
jgi:hypothetical protein